ncbi:hypothetical protein FO519_005952 [Halicephalobus sp. NKZ332]|nr:hypothetical protein FO519_005952 [Halicephalobus sp. NKZ332]
MRLTGRRLALKLSNMVKIIKIRTEKEYFLAAEEARKVLGNGGIVALPTDTIYGISTRLEFVDSIYRLKQRPHEKPLGIFVGNVDQIHQ